MILSVSNSGNYLFNEISLNEKNHQIFPTTHHANFPRYTNWDLRETIQTKKTLTKKYKKKQYFAFNMDHVVPKTIRGDNLLLFMVGDLFKEKQQEPNKKQEKHSTPFLWISLVYELLEQNKEPNIQKS
ncbi:hypothetical protein M0812_10444 [Anaeramoeba flamelloides]|uniref:Uncharacterized protein n=1 Tax=Anaeramoeba flamelloides TaxID=1746091 RepID=A0AAV7ZVS4_9EUKA|nr:hypothetical protein M0812_10444 [Anaeramoeba flamelloides]